LERQVAKSAVLGLGYGMGYKRFMEYCKVMGIKGVDEEIARHIVQLYRSTFGGIRKLWSQANKAGGGMCDGQYDVSIPFEGEAPVYTCTDPLFNSPAIKLPNGLCIKYPGLHIDGENQLKYIDGKTEAKLFGGKVVENIVQA